VNIEINFDINAGTFVFDTDDTITFPGGVYTFEISITIGVSVHVTTFSMTIIASCEAPDLVVQTMPDPTNYIILGDGSCYCPDGEVWNEDACMCFAEIQCAMMCQPGEQLDPRFYCDCIPHTQYNAIMA
jgi:hypothetical protein